MKIYDMIYLSGLDEIDRCTICDVTDHWNINNRYERTDL